MVGTYLSKLWMVGKYLSNLDGRNIFVSLGWKDYTLGSLDNIDGLNEKVKFGWSEHVGHIIG